MTLMNSVMGVINIVLTGAIIYMLMVFPGGINVEQSTEGIISYTFALLVIVAIVAISNLWYTYTVRYEMSIMHTEIQEQLDFQNSFMQRYAEMMDRRNDGVGTPTETPPVPPTN